MGEMLKSIGPDYLSYILELLRRSISAGKFDIYDGIMLGAFLANGTKALLCDF